MSDADHRITTLREEITEIKKEIEKLPTRWEVRFLIVAALIAGRFIPTQIMGGTHAAMQALTGVIL